jgi:hypothetical protein
MLRLRLLQAADGVVHRVIPESMPWPLWAWHICHALGVEADRRGRPDVL